MKKFWCLLMLAAAGAALGAPARRVLNVVNFVRALDPRMARTEYVRALDEEVKLNLKYGFRNTILLQYDALVDAEMLAVARKSDPAKTEFGFWFEMSQPLNEAAGLAWKPTEKHKDWKWDWFINPGFLMAYDHDGRRRLVDAAFAKFKEIFGAYPKSVGSWLLDAYSMDYMVEKYGVDGFCICREQDNTDAYGLRGGYSNGAYYPSKKNMLSAAVDMKNAVRAPVFKMLTPDPIHNYGDPRGMYADYPFRNGCATMEPVWDSGFEPRIVDWFFRVYTRPQGLLNLSYMQAGQENSFGWANISKGWPMQCAKIAAEAAAGRVVVETMGETARRFKADHPANCPQTQIALEDWNGDRRRSVWYNSRCYRANLILEQGRLAFRDLHKMADDFEEPFLNRVCTGWQALYFTPPVVDQWLFRDGAASGTMAFDGTFTALATEADGDDALVVTATRPSGERVTVRFAETGVEVVGSGLTADYSAAFRKTISISSRELGFVFSGCRYRVPVAGTLTATERGFRLAGDRVALDLSASAACSPAALGDFWRENDGRTVRRLPVNVMPENVFWSLGTRDFADGMKAFNRLMDESFAKSTYNCITLTLRCNPELGDPETIAAAKACFARAHREGVKVYMDTDPRIARREFFSKWPDERQSLVNVVSVASTNGAASFSTTFDAKQDHMSWGSRSAYRPLNGKVLSAFAVKKRADGGLDFASKRPVEVKAKVDVAAWRDDRKAPQNQPVDPQKGFTEFSEVTVSGSAAGLAADETLVATIASEYAAIDIFSPHLIPFCRSLMSRYKDAGADGGMRDEWGFVPNYSPDLRTFFWSPNFAAAYRTAFGRDLLVDLPLLACGPNGDAERSAAIDAYMKLTLRRNVEIERDFYETDKRLFGDDVYVAKHPTWYSSICPQEFFHNGLDWWQAPRDWAQSDEEAPFFAVSGMAKKFGGPVWLNEGYTATPERNVYRVWTYAMCGGRQVYHGLYSGDAKAMAKYRAMPWEESRVRKATDLLAVGNVTAQSRVRLASLISNSQVDSPLAYVFSHEDLVDWSGSGWRDYGHMKLFALLAKGWWGDAYPASEFALGTFWVDDEGWLRVGRQRYVALATYHLRPAERAALDAVVKGRSLKTRLFDIEDAAGIAACLEQAGATRQPVVKVGTKAGPFYPEPDGTLRLIDGTAIRIKADFDHPCGLPVAETLESNGVGISFAAEGLFAARAEEGKVVAVAAGALARVEGPGISLRLDRPEDVALLKIDGEWHGIWQTATPEAPIPAPLQKLCGHWTRLVIPGR